MFCLAIRFAAKYSINKYGHEASVESQIALGLRCIYNVAVRLFLLGVLLGVGRNKAALAALLKHKASILINLSFEISD